MALELWTPRDLADMRQDLRLDPVPDFFLRNFFKRSFYSDDQDIRFVDLPKPFRKLAPFVMPSSQGKPIFERRGEAMHALTPPYIKPKDAVRPTDARNILPSQIYRNGGDRLPTLQERFDQRVSEVIAFHLRAINMQKAWMAARAILDGKVTISYAADQGVEYPEVIVDFKRDSNLTDTLSGTFWSSSTTYDILGDLSTWSNRMYGAVLGGRPTDVILGANVVPHFVKNEPIKELLNTNYRGGEDTTLKRGLLGLNDYGDLQPIGRIGGIGQALDIWTYRDYVEAPNGDMVDIFSPDDIFMFAPGVDGVMAHGAIYNANAALNNMMSVDVYASMWNSNDPGDIYLMHECSPLPIPFYPNRTFKATVLP